MVGGAHLHSVPPVVTCTHAHHIPQFHPPYPSPPAAHIKYKAQIANREAFEDAVHCIDQALIQGLNLLAELQHSTHSTSGVLHLGHTDTHCRSPDRASLLYAICKSCVRANIAIAELVKPSAAPAAVYAALWTPNIVNEYVNGSRQSLLPCRARRNPLHGFCAHPRQQEPLDR